MKVLLSDIGGVVARDLYNDLLDRLLLQECSSGAPPTEQSIFDCIMKCAQDSWSVYKLGQCDEAQFFLNITSQSPLVQEIRRRGFLISSSYVVDDDVVVVESTNSWTADEEERLVVQFLMREIREKQLRLFDHVVQMMLDWKEKYAVENHVVFAVLSNHSVEWLPELFRIYADRLGVLFDRKSLIFNSALIGAAKPDREAFDIARRSIEKELGLVDGGVGVPILFVDDKMANVNAAIDAGLSAFHFNALQHEVSCLEDQLNTFFLN